MKSIFFTLVLFFSFNAIGQSYEVGAWLGGTNYFGDINTATTFKDSRVAGGLLGKYNLDSRLAGELTVSYGQVFELDRKFDEPQQINRNEAIRNTFLDVSIAAEFNFYNFNSTNSFEKSVPFTPYLGAGVGYSLIKPEVYLRDDGWTNAIDLPTEDDKKVSRHQVQIPLSGGVKYQMNSDFNLAMEFSSHLLFTDYFDDLSTVYNDFSATQNIGNISPSGRQRGDRFKNDVYNLFGLQLTYVIPIHKCPGE